MKWDFIYLFIYLMEMSMVFHPHTRCQLLAKERNYSFKVVELPFLSQNLKEFKNINDYCVLDLQLFFKATRID